MKTVIAIIALAALAAAVVLIGIALTFLAWPVKAQDAEPKFHASIVACWHVLPGAPPNCVRFDDERGPYPSAAACRIRVAEMLRHLARLVPGIVRVAPACGKSPTVDREGVPI